jgi:hypothetical protein
VQVDIDNFNRAIIDKNEDSAILAIKPERINLEFSGFHKLGVETGMSPILLEQTRLLVPFLAKLMAIKIAL